MGSGGQDAATRVPPLPTPHSPLPDFHFFPPAIWESTEAEPPP
jgi:hypothetical protein